MDVAPYVFDLDDLGEGWDCYDELIAIKREYPGLKVTLFAVPGRLTTEMLAKYTALDWVELAVHGYHHASAECAVWTEDDAKERMDEVMEWWPGVKGFKAPGWVMSKEAYPYFDKNGWWLADHADNGYRWGESTAPRYLYNGRTDLVALHGHTWDCCGNGPSDWAEMFKDVPKDAHFKFVSEVVR